MKDSKFLVDQLLNEGRRLCPGCGNPILGDKRVCDECAAEDEESDEEFQNSGENFEDELRDTIESNFSCRTETFREAGFLTGNNGIVVHLRNGTEYQVTIVRVNRR